MGSNISVAVDTTAGGVTRYISERQGYTAPAVVNTRRTENPPFQFRCGCSHTCSETVAIDSLVKVWEVGQCDPGGFEGWKPWPSSQIYSGGSPDWISLSPRSCYVVLTLHQSCARYGASALTLGAKSSSAALEKLFAQLTANVTPESLAAAAYVGVATDALRFHDGRHACPSSVLEYEIHVLHGISASLRARGLVSSAATHLHLSLSTKNDTSFHAIDPSGSALGKPPDYRDIESRWVLLNESSACRPSSSQFGVHSSFSEQSPALIRYFLNCCAHTYTHHAGLLKEASLAAFEALSSNGSLAGLEMRRQAVPKLGDRALGNASIPFPLVISPRTISAVIADASPVVSALAVSPRGVRLPTHPSQVSSDGFASRRPVAPLPLIDRQGCPPSLRPGSAVVPGLPLSATLFEGHGRGPDGISSPPKRLRRERDGVMECEGVSAGDGAVGVTSPVARPSASPAPRLSGSGSPLHPPCDIQLRAVPADKSVLHAVDERKRVPGLALRELPGSAARPLIPSPEDCQGEPSVHGLRQQPSQTAIGGVGNCRRQTQVPIPPAPPPLFPFQRPTSQTGLGPQPAIPSGVSVAPSSACSRDSRTDGTMSNVGPSYLPSNQQPISLPPRAMSSDAVIDSYCSGYANSPASSPGRESDDEALGGEGASKEALFALHRPVCSEVIPGAGLFISGVAVSQDLGLLRSHGITDIVNIAGDTCQNYFPSMFRYVTFVLQDNRHSSEDIQSVLYNALEYISTALSDSTSRVLVHCREGVSRSATVVAAYLMWKGRINFADALTILRRARPLCNPNTGFTFVLLRLQKGLANRRSVNDASAGTAYCNVELAAPVPFSSRLDSREHGDPGSPTITTRGFRRVYSASPRSDGPQSDAPTVERKLLQLRPHHQNAAFLVAVGIAQYEPVQRVWMPAPPAKGLDPRFFYIVRDNDLICFWRGGQAIHKSLAHSFLIHEYLRHLQIFEGSGVDKSWRVMFVNEGAEPESFWSCLYPEDGGRRVAQQSEFDSAFHILRESEIFNFAEYCRRQRVGEHQCFNAFPQMPSHLPTSSTTGVVSGPSEPPNVRWTGGASDSSGLLDSLDTGQSTNRSETSTLRRRFTLADHLPPGSLDQDNGSLQERIASKAGSSEAYVILSPRKRRLVPAGAPRTGRTDVPKTQGVPCGSPPLVPTRSMPAFVMPSHPCLSNLRNSSLGSLRPAAVDNGTAPPDMQQARASDASVNTAGSVVQDTSKEPIPSLAFDGAAMAKAPRPSLEDQAAFHSSRSQFSTSRTNSATQRHQGSGDSLHPRSAGPSLVKADMRCVRVREGKVELEVDMPYLYEWPYFSNPLEAFDDEDLRSSGFFIVVQYGPRPLLEMLGSCQSIADKNSLAVLAPPTMADLPVGTESVALGPGRPGVPSLPSVIGIPTHQRSDTGFGTLVKSPRNYPILFTEAERSHSSDLPAQRPATATSLRLVPWGSDEGGNPKPSFGRAIEIPSDVMPSNQPIQPASSSQADRTKQQTSGDFPSPLPFREVEIETVVTPTILWVWRGKHWRQQQLRGDPSDNELLEEFKQMHGILPTDEDVIVHWEDDGRESDAFQKLLWLS